MKTIADISTSPAQPVETNSSAASRCETDVRFDRIARLAAALTQSPIGIVAFPGEIGPRIRGIFGTETAAVSDFTNNVMQRVLSQPGLALFEPDHDEVELAGTSAGPATAGKNRQPCYSAVPISDKHGKHIGTLAVVHQKHRQLDHTLQQHLTELAALVSDSLERADQAATASPTPIGSVPSGDHADSIFNALFVFVAILDIDGTLLGANDPALRTAGLQLDDVKGKPFWESRWWSFSDASRNRMREAVLVAATGEISRFVTAVRLANDQIVAIDFLISPLRDGNGTVKNLIASGVDISRRRKAEADLGRIGQIVEEAPFLMRSATRDGHVNYLNRRGREMLGYDPEIELSDVMVAHHHPEWVLKLLEKEAYPAAAANGQWVGETAIIGGDGREVPTSHAIVAHFDADGEVEFFSTIAIDISGQKDVESALKESELRFRGTFENAAVGMAHVGMLGRWIRVNERLLEIVGYARSELVRMTFQEITHPDDLANDLELFERLKDGEIDSYSLEKRCFRKDGAIIWVEITISMQETNGGGEPYVIAIIEDISERKSAEQRQRLLLAELNHRVKNTLAMIQSIANQTLRQTSEPRQFVTSFLGRLRSLSGAHDLLTKQVWDGADMAELLKSQVGLDGAVDPSRFDLAGPNILIPPQVSLNLALIIHEMATNALQHGAFANATGRVGVTWSLSSEPDAEGKLLTIHWSETGGPPVSEKRRAGFGSIILERGLRLGLAGSYDLEWRTSGLVATLKVPLPASAFRKELFAT